MNRIQIANGAHMTVFNAEKFKRCRVALHFIWPSQREMATAQALLPLLMERSYSKCPDMTALSKRLAALYGASLSVELSNIGANRVLSVAVSGIQDVYALEGEKLSQEYAQMALDVAFSPYFVDGVFDAENVAIEKEQLREQLESEINDKRGYCVRQARRKFYGNSPEGIERFGYLDELDGITPQDVTNAWQQMVNTAQMEIMVLGADENIVSQSVCDALTKIDRKPMQMVEGSARPRIETLNEEEPMDTVQGKLCMLFTLAQPAIGRDFTVFRVATALFGGIPTSRLFLNVREKMSLCYYCAAYGDARNGMLCVDSGVEHQNAKAAQNAILAELDALRNGPITEKELAETKRSIKGRLQSAEDSLGGIESWYFYEILRGDTIKTPEETIQEIETVTAEEIAELLKRFSLSVVYTLTKEENA